MAVDIGLTVGLTDLFLSQIIMSSAILSSAHCAVNRASASWSQQSSIVSLSDLTACQETNKQNHLILYYFPFILCSKFTVLWQHSVCTKIVTSWWERKTEGTQFHSKLVCPKPSNTEDEYYHTSQTHPLGRQLVRKSYIYQCLYNLQPVPSDDCMLSSLSLPYESCILRIDDTWGMLSISSQFS